MPKLSRKEEQIAKARAQKFGRPYPNPIDISAALRSRNRERGNAR